MIYLLLSITMMSLLFVIFKLFTIFKVHTLQAIVVNYLVACVLGFFLSEVSMSLTEVPSQPWFFGAVLLGVLFIVIFNVMAKTSQENGLTVASVASKMSLVIPIVFALIVYGESMSVNKGVGILLALLAVYLTSVTSEKSEKVSKGLLMPILLFLGSGMIDTTLKYVEVNHVSEDGLALFSASLFGIAFLLGLLFVIVQFVQKKATFNFKNIIAGIVLGVPNYFSIFFLLKALSTEGLESSTAFTLNNVGVVVLSTVLGLLLFKEKLSVKNWIGVAVAIISIFLVVNA